VFIEYTRKITVIVDFVYNNPLALFEMRWDNVYDWGKAKGD